MQVLTEPDAERVRALRERDEFFWLDLCAPADGALNEIAPLLGLHPLALEDTLEFGQPPKVDPFGDQVLLVFYSARILGPDAQRFEPLEVHVYVHGGFVMTVHHEPSPVLDELHATIAVKEGLEEEIVVYQVLDALADAYLPVIAAVDDRVDEVEAEVLVHPRNDHLRRIYRLKQDLHAVSRRVYAQKETFPGAVDAILALPGLERSAREYLRDVDDRLRETAGDLHRLNQDLTELSSTFFNANTNRLSLVATRLSVLAAVFFVATFVTSFFGQNFKWMTDNLQSRTAFLVYGIGILVFATVVTSAFFVWRRKDFF